MTNDNSNSADSRPPGAANLRAALGAGDPQQVLALIAAGADVHYKADAGYGALLDAVHSHDVARDVRLLETLALLFEHGVELSGISAYGESGLRVLSRLGRFDAVRFLLDAGADERQLEWTPLMAAVAMGSLADVEAALAQGQDLEAKDWWSRTPWLIALLTGDVAKATLLRDRGADQAARGRCGQTPLSYAIQSENPEMLRWLLAEGQDVNQRDEFGKTPLMEAVGQDDGKCVRILIAAGADVAVDANGTAIREVESREVALRLLDAGADPADLTASGRRVILGLPEADDHAIASAPAELFRGAFAHSFGTSNPERMSVPLWEAMIRCGTYAYAARKRIEAERGDEDLEPVWCADRFGQSLTLLPDGRAVLIGGEHEDHYDPDFCIYNDVIVFERDPSFALYGYPKDVFPPTDFHTATLVEDGIYIIGSLGYVGTRLYGTTPVYRLDLPTLRIDRIDAGGTPPGWLYKHRAVLSGSREIRVWGGTVVTRASGEAKESYEPNVGVFVLDLERLQWRREP